MAISCPRCGAGYDVTLFQFGHRLRCDCGAWVDLGSGHVSVGPVKPKEATSMVEEEIGKVTHYFSKIHVAGIEITRGSLHVGDTIHVHGHTSDFTEKIDSLQIDNQPVDEATAGQVVGLTVPEHARVHDVVFKVVG
jgi:hypothetical protein